MAECISLTALIASAVSAVDIARLVLNTVCSTVSEDLHEPLDSRMKLLLFELETSVGKLTEWRDLWIPEDPKSEASFLLLWGDAGQHEIRSHLESIHRPANAITEQVSELETALQSKQTTTEKTSTGSWFRWLFSLPSLRNKGRTVRDRLSESVAELVSAISALQVSTDKHFRVIHATTQREEQNEDRLDEICSSRTISTAIYEQCSQNNVDCHLDLNLLNNELDIDKFPDIFDWRDIIPEYHIVFPGTSARDQAIHLRLDSSPCDDSSNEGVVAEAKLIKEILNDPPPDGITQCLVDLQTDKPTTYLNGEVSTSTLSAQAVRIVHEPSECNGDLEHNLLTIAQKAGLAYRVVECGLLLIGTPWLSHLSSTALVHVGAFFDDGQCSICISPNSIQGGACQQAESTDRSHVYKIGVLLVEIALAIPWQDTFTEFRRLGTGIAKRIEDETGVSYRTACESCFLIASDNDPAIQSSAAILTNYYKDVFLRLRDSLHRVE